MFRSGVFVRDLVDLFFPVTCPGCGNEFLTGGELICLGCRMSLPFCDFAIWRGNPMEIMLEGRMNSEASCALLYFEKKGLVQNLIHHLKYKGMQDLGCLFGDLLAEEMINSGRFNGLDCVIAVPLHPAKLKQRGYNQIAAFAKRLSFRLDLSICSETLKRWGQTTTQTSKDRSQRTELLDSSFYLVGEDRLRGKHVLLVDDVVTTGATLEAIANILKRIDGLRLSVATVAFTR